MKVNSEFNMSAFRLTGKFVVLVVLPLAHLTMEMKRHFYYFMIIWFVNPNELILSKGSTFCLLAVKIKTTRDFCPLDVEFFDILSIKMRIYNKEDLFEVL